MVGALTRVGPEHEPGAETRSDKAPTGGKAHEGHPIRNGGGAKQRKHVFLLMLGLRTIQRHIERTRLVDLFDGKVPKYGGGPPTTKFQNP